MTMTGEKTERNSAVEFATTSRVHVAINVRNLERSLPFYQTLFAQEPTKLRPGYAKFEVAEPPVNFTLNENPNIQTGVGTFSHFGIQVKSSAEVLNAKTRFIEAKLATFDEENVTCCYAVQDKVWVTDPDGNSWEVFVVLDADAPVHSENRNPQVALSCACDTPAEVAASGKLIPLASKGANSCC
jgi:catechol 2,3-dioxygenase-like lactoylglutathione lyase family enzyme